MSIGDPCLDARIEITVMPEERAAEWMSRPDQQAIFVAAVRSLAAAAEVARCDSQPSDQRSFYDGVRHAAEHALDPGLDNQPSVEADGLDRGDRAFRDGYLTAAAQLISAMSADDPPLHLALPAFSAPLRAKAANAGTQGGTP
jgi:hypothetical protein